MDDGSFSRKNFRYFLISNSLSLLLVWVLWGCGPKNKNQGNTSDHDPQRLAWLYLSQNHLGEAEDAFTEAIQQKPGDLSNYISLTRLYLLQKNFDSAESLIGRGLILDPGNSDLKLILGETFVERGEPSKGVQEFKKLLASDPRNIRAWYALAQYDTSGSGPGKEKYYLLKLLNLVPANIVPRLKLAELLAGEHKTDSSHFFLQSVKRIAPDFSESAGIFYKKATTLLDAGQPFKALPFMLQFHDLMKVTPAYISGNEAIQFQQMHAGYFGFYSNIRALEAGSGNKASTDQSGILSQMKFTDALESPGLKIGTPLRGPAEHTVMALTDNDEQGNMFLYASYETPGSSSLHCHLYINNSGYYSETRVIGGIGHSGQDLCATFADYDNDGYQDLFIATTRGILVYKNQGDGTFIRVEGNIGLGNAVGVRKMIFADFDQDGDLDLYAAEKGGNRFFRNNGDGTFTENAAAMGLRGNIGGSLDLDYGDWDNDGDLDILGLRADGTIQLFNNNRHSYFNEIADSAGLRNPGYSGTAVAFGDLNNDGRLDIVVAGGPGGACWVLENEGGKRFRPDTLASHQLSRSLKGIRVRDMALVDFDNDGREDILVAGTNQDSSKSGVKLFHNEGARGFRDLSSLLPGDIRQASHIGIADFNDDGDEDIYLAGQSGIQLIRNDGGNLNHYFQIQLTGLSFGDSRNNRLGIGAQVELKAGDLYQMKTVKGPQTEFGVGPRTRLDAVRIIWPNGVPQTVIDPMKKERILEQDQLKGSCPYLFAWNGTKYEFLKDMMWRSALGMPLAIKGTDTTYAYPGASKEYLLIPGNQLKPRDGRFHLEITEELWEAVFFDKVALFAVDHPDSVDPYVDERFVDPPYPGRKLYLVSHKYLPVSAVNGRGDHEMPKLRSYDFQYVNNFSLGIFQGLAKEHDLILDLGKKALGDSLWLFLRGWVFPTDASINTELTQTRKYRLRPPSLQVINKEGKWQTVIRNMGYPMGRDKMVIADLSGKFLTPGDRRVRIRTNMQVYWDHIFFSTAMAHGPVEMRKLKLARAQLGYHGYSADYRKGGPYGPEWLHYYRVTKGQKWRDLSGYYTRYGNVLPLLTRADDEYVIANSGDQLSLQFDARDLPQLPKGWKRDFLIYSEGWVKDGDLNTARSQTLDPLPFHGMPSYPYGRNSAYPSDKEHREYLKKYDTRRVGTRGFRDALRFGQFEDPSQGARP